MALRKLKKPTPRPTTKAAPTARLQTPLRVRRNLHLPQRVDAQVQSLARELGLTYSTTVILALTRFVEHYHPPAGTALTSLPSSSPTLDLPSSWMRQRHPPDLPRTVARNNPVYRYKDKKGESLDVPLNELQQIHDFDINHPDINSLSELATAMGWDERKIRALSEALADPKWQVLIKGSPEDDDSEEDDGPLSDPLRQVIAYDLEYHPDKYSDPSKLKKSIKAFHEFQSTKGALPQQWKDKTLEEVEEGFRWVIAKKKG